MKKLVLLLILPLLLCSCGVGKITSQQMLIHQEHDLSCVYYADDFTAEVAVRRADGELLITYLSPESLSGLTFAVSEGGVEIIIGDARYPLPAENNGHLLKISSLLNLDSKDYKKLETSNGGISYEALFECDTGNVILSYDMRERRTTLITADDFELEICSVGITEENETTESVQ